MALLSSVALIRSLALFHLTLAYYFLVAPQTIASQSVVFLMGEAMQLPTPQTSFSGPSPATALLGLVLGLFGLSDLVAATFLPDVVGAIFWATQAPVRLTFLFGVLGYIYLYKDGGMLGGPISDDSFALDDVTGDTAGDMVRNSVVFAWAFLELVTWFWALLALRDERRTQGMKAMHTDAQGQENAESS